MRVYSGRDGDGPERRRAVRLRPPGPRDGRALLRARALAQRPGLRRLRALGARVRDAVVEFELRAFDHVA